MTWLIPWALLFFFLIFCGIFLLVFYSTKTQDRALQDILHQQRAMRMELDRLASALDALLADRPLRDDEDESAPGATRPAEAVPGLDRLLLGPAGDQARPGQDAMPGALRAPNVPDGLPDLKL